MTRRNRPTAPCSASSQDFENDAGKVPMEAPECARIVCPCCGFSRGVDQFYDAPSQVRGILVRLMHEEGMTQKQITQVTGWNYSTVRRNP